MFITDISLECGNHPPVKRDGAYKAQLLKCSGTVRVDLVDDEIVIKFNPREFDCPGPDCDRFLNPLTGTGIRAAVSAIVKDKKRGIANGLDHQDHRH